MNYFEEIKKALIKKGIKISISKDTKFEDMDIDSLDLMDMVVTLEEKLNITVPDEKLVELKKVDDLILLVEELKK